MLVARNALEQLGSVFRKQCHLARLLYPPELHEVSCLFAGACQAHNELRTLGHGSHFEACVDERAVTLHA